MLGIKLEQPFSLLMEVVETDDHVPSMRVETKITITQFQHMLSYQGSFWIECANWSSFSNALNNSSLDATLKDMNDHFVLAISENKDKKILYWEFKKTDAGGGKKTIIAFSAEVDDDMLAKIKREFAEFPAWWSPSDPG
ncbi:hypothetical protein [Caldimonas sp.]|uniref:hypothetical protein n=1 Tax=Caldimonas sp. TaxID=2838790 RepID=UPI00391D134E